MGATAVIGNLLKQLFKALGSSIRYRLSRLFGRRGPNLPNTSSMTGTIPTVGLDPAYTKTVTWRTDQNDLEAPGTASNPIYQLWRATSGGHKFTHYFEIYEAVFGARRNTPMRVLEIGVLQGASLRLWKSYFQHPQTILVGVDIEPECARFDAPADSIHVRIGSQADDKFLAGVLAEFGPFDLIIDDGSHQSAHMIKSFNSLYAAGLKDDGIYFVEDLHANYWPDWRDSANSFLDFGKDLLELMHAHYWQNQLSTWTAQAGSGSSLGVEVPEITTMIKEIRFFDSIVAIYKTRRAHCPRYTIS
jgi:SAM-dependent methyltransferase